MKLTQYIGAEGAAFERVGLAFEAVGYQRPRPESSGDGAYVNNIVRQYESDLTPRQVKAIIQYGLDYDRGALQATIGVYTVDDLEAMYDADLPTSTHGGPGRGQGRKPIGDAVMERHGVTLPVYLAQRLRQLGGGNLSAGIRAAVEMLDGG